MAARKTVKSAVEKTVDKTDQKAAATQRDAVFRKRMLIGIGAGVGVIAALTAVLFILTIQTTPRPVQAQSALTIESDRLLDMGLVAHPDGFRPLTGLPFFLDASLDEAQRAEQAAAIINARPINMKIENSYDARPQAGLSRADVVYESLAEGGITRFNCVFQSDLTAEVGPVRSARISDISIVPQYQGILFYSGSSEYVGYQLGNADLPRITEGVEGFRRVEDRYAPHDLFYTLPLAYADAWDAGYETTLAYPPTLEFLRMASPEDVALAAVLGLDIPLFSADTLNPPATPVSQFIVPFSPGFECEWQWSGEGLGGRWLRSQDGISIEALDDTQVAATNVVVLWAYHYEIDPYQGLDIGGETYEIDLNGSGYASVFSQGGRIDGTWETDGTTPPRLRDYNGAVIYLTPGNTWFQVLPPDTDVSAW